MASIGIITAIKSAQAAAKVILSEGADADAYCKAVNIQHQKSLATRIAYYQLEKRWTQSLFWSRRHDN
jgi:flavin-dependent dehydrogenase